MAAIFLNPKNDVAFKKIFGTEKNKDILIRFLNDVLTFKECSPILDVEFIKTSQDPEIAAQKASIVDILCKDEKGNKYIVEMQVAKTKGFEKRAQFYAAKTYCSQAHVGDEYQDLKEVIFLAIVDYEIFPNKSAYKSDHIILDKETYEQDLKDFSFTFISLPKFTKIFEELSTLEERWCYFLKYAEQTTPEDLKKIIAMDGIIEKAYNELNKYYWTDQELLDYDQAEKVRRDYLASLAQKFDEGIALGKSEGIALGKSEGIALGEVKRNYEIAYQMLLMDIPMDTIEKVTGLSQKELSELEEKNYL